MIHKSSLGPLFLPSGNIYLCLPAPIYVRGPLENGTSLVEIDFFLTQIHSDLGVTLDAP